MTFAPQQPSRSRAPLILAIVFGVLAIIAVRAVVNRGDDTASPGRGDPSLDASCTQLTVVSSPEKVGLIREVAADFNRDKPTVAGKCAQAVVASKSSGGAAEALARGWDDAIDGPRPDVWSPAGGIWATIVEQRTAAGDKGDLVPDETPSIAQTPLVVAMPRPMAEALGWPNKPLGWKDLLSLTNDPRGWGAFGHPEWGRFKLGKTNPNFSTSGLNALVGTYFAATERSSDLSDRDVANPAIRSFVQGVENGVVHYGDTTLTFLSNLQKADDAGQGLTYISAVTVEEKSVLDYNAGNPTGDPATLGRHGKPRIPLVAVYPKEGTLLSDNPYVVLTAPWVDDAKRAAANEFLSYLRKDKAQQRFQEFAFRTFEGKAGKQITRENGLLAEEPKLSLSPPAPAVLAKVLESWTQLRKKARVLMVIDVSGSMGEPVPKAGASKLELAKRAAASALGQFAAEDDLGLWVFSTELDKNLPYKQMVPIKPVKDGLNDVRRSIQGLVPDGGTGLYATTRAAVRFMQQGFDPSRINAVLLLTDGRNEYPADTNLDSLVREVGSESTATGVRVFTIGYGDDADLPTLRRIAEASRAAAYDASDPASIERVFTAVVSNF